MTPIYGTGRMRGPVRPTGSNGYLGERPELLAAKGRAVQRKVDDLRITLAQLEAIANSSDAEAIDDLRVVIQDWSERLLDINKALRAQGQKEIA